MAFSRRMFVGGLAATIVPVPSVVAGPTPAGDGFTVLEARAGAIRLLPEPAAETSVWGYGGHVPGPVLRIRKGDEIKVRLLNKLTQPTSISWHGVRIANAMDGVAGLTQAPVPPGGSFDYRFTPPDSGLSWYHPHVFPVSAEQIGRGLYGALIVDEADPPKVDRDLLVVLDDWSLDDKGAIAGAFLDPAKATHEGRIGSLVTVDSAPAPARLRMRPGSRVRLRLLNACGARIAIVTFVGAKATVIALDGQPSEIFQPVRDTIPLGPGSRFEVMLDLPADAGRDVSLTLRGAGDADRLLMVLTTEGNPVPAPMPVAKLRENALLPTRIPLEKSLKRNLVIGGGAGPPSPDAKPHAVGRMGTTQWAWTIDGVGSNGFSGQPLFKVKRGTAVTLAFVNKTAFVQQMHVHGVAMRILHDLDDGWDPYWRDSVLVGPGRTKHVAFIADNPGKWAIESLVLDRQVTGLATWFEVI